jgi:hypothetical protein
MKTQETSRVVFTYWLQTHVGKITKPAYTFVGYVFVMDIQKLTVSTADLNAPEP